MSSTLKFGTLAAAMIAISLDTASATLLNTVVDTTVGGTSSSGVVVAPNQPIEFDDFIHSTTAENGDINGIIFQDSYYFTPTTNSYISSFAFTSGTITGFELELDGITQTAVNLSNTTATTTTTTGNGSTLTSLALDDYNDVLTPGDTYALIVDGANETGVIGSYTAAFGLTATPLPAGLPLIAGGLGLVGWLSSRSRKQNVEGKANFIAA